LAINKNGEVSFTRPTRAAVDLNEIRPHVIETVVEDHSVLRMLAVEMSSGATARRRLTEGP